MTTFVFVELAVQVDCDDDGDDTCEKDEDGSDPGFLVIGE